MCRSVRHSPDPPTSTRTSCGPRRSGSGTSSTTRRSPYRCSRTALLAPLQGGVGTGARLARATPPNTGIETVNLPLSESFQDPIEQEISVSKLVAPQLVISSRMLYLTWIPADSEAVGKLVDPRLGRIANGQCFINQYVVDKAEQTSGFGE